MLTAPLTQGSLSSETRLRERKNCLFAEFLSFLSLRHNFLSLPCVKGGGFCEAKDGGIVKYRYMTIPQSRCSRDSPLYTRGPMAYGSRAARRAPLQGGRGAVRGCGLPRRQSRLAMTANYECHSEGMERSGMTVGIRYIRRRKCGLPRRRSTRYNAAFSASRKFHLYLGFSSPHKDHSSLWGPR